MLFRTALLLVCAPLASAQQRSAGQCGDLPCLPGLDAMGLGFDIVKGSSDRLQQVIEFTYGEKPDQFVNPFDSKLIYAFPSEASAKDNTSGQQSVVSDSFTSSSSYAASLARSAGIEASVGMFAASESVKSMQHKLEATADYGSVVKSELLVTLYDITLAPGPLLKTTDFFDQFVAKLPATYETPEDKSDYLSFITYYGSHYVSAATFGGSGTMETAVNTEYSSSSSEQKISAQASAHFAWLIKGGASSEEEVDQSEEEFREGSSFSTSVVGGDPTELEDWAIWTKTFYAAPAMIQLTLHPLSELVRGINATLAGNIDKAVAEYAGGAAALCAAESDQIKALNDQIASLNDQVADQKELIAGAGNCFYYNFHKSSGLCDTPYKGWTCATEISKDGAPVVPRFTNNDLGALGFDTEEECKASTRCYGKH